MNNWSCHHLTQSCNMQMKHVSLFILRIQVIWAYSLKRLAKYYVTLQTSKTASTKNRSKKQIRQKMIWQGFLSSNFRLYIQACTNVLNTIYGLLDELPQLQHQPTITQAWFLLVRSGKWEESTALLAGLILPNRATWFLCNQEETSRKYSDHREDILECTYHLRWES